MSPSEIESWSARDLADFMEYDQLQPFGSERDNWHAALIAQIIAAAHTARNRKPPSVKDFMFVDEQTRQEDKVVEMDQFFDKVKRGRPS